jgi:uncharacterized delta-60 repeat protein
MNLDVRRPRSAARLRPRLEVLEPRCLPSAQLDAGFGASGLVVASPGGLSRWSGNAVAVQPDGKIVVAGQARNAAGRDVVAVARFDAAGQLDPAFGSAGVTAVDPGSGFSSQGRGVLVQPGGNIVVVGIVTQLDSGAVPDSAAHLVRLRPDGSPDTSFGTGGARTGGFARHTGLTSIVPLASGGFLVGGHATVPPPDLFSNQQPIFFVARYSASGAGDTSFGNNGFATTAADILPFDGFESSCLAQQNDGRILVGGFARGLDQGVPSNPRFILARFTSTGLVDTSFGGGNGFVSTFFSNEGPSFLWGITLQPDNRIVAVGGRLATDRFVGLMVRYNANGSLDGTFAGGAGTVQLNPQAGASNVAYAVNQTADGKILVGGKTTTSIDGGAQGALLQRFNADGTPDTSFAPAGTLVTAAGPLNSSAIYALNVLGSGRIVVAGVASTSLLLGRFFEPDPPVPVAPPLAPQEPTTAPPLVNLAPRLVRASAGGLVSFRGRSRMAVTAPAGTSLRVTLLGARGTWQAAAVRGVSIRGQRTRLLRLTGAVEAVNRALALMKFKLIRGFAGLVQLRMSAFAPDMTPDTDVVKLFVARRR